MHGILNINKPSNNSSFEIVKRIRKAAGLRKVGHTGTLDPMAYGVLIVCLGEATKIVPYLMETDKAYTATMSLGKTTDTLDGTGTVTGSHVVEPISNEELEQILEKFRGVIEQIPPMYSALHYNGERLYKLAREHKKVDLPARKINIKKLTVIDRDLLHIKLYVECSKGTYIRTLVNDIGEKIGCGAYLEELCRVRVGRYNIEQAVDILNIQNKDDVVKYLIPMEDALSEFETVTLKIDSERFVKNGMPIAQMNVEEDISCFKNRTMVKIFSANKEFLAVGEKNVYNQQILIKRGFNF